MFKKIIDIVIAALFLPVCLASGIILYQEFGAIKSVPQEQMYFFYGCIFYLIFHAIVLKPETVYVFAHEIMHAIAAILSGGKVHSIKVSKKSGSVTSSKNNMFISLAPYLFPFYTIIASMIYFAIMYFTKSDAVYLKPFLFIIGATLTFHLVLTIDVLKTKQTDLLGLGYLFSIELIYLINMAIVVYIFSLLFKEVVIGRYFNSLVVEAKHMYIAVFRQLFL